MNNSLRLFVNKSEELAAFVAPGIKPVLALIGSYNSGKSTLLNFLLEENISPVGAVPTTRCLLYFDYGDSFTAKYSKNGSSCAFTDRQALNSFLTTQKLLGGRVDIALPAAILKKCRLIDTPGLDSFAQASLNMAEEAVKQSDKIIYLFHQRGIENLNRYFLQKLRTIWKDRNLNDLFFGLNCNLGHCDGTSLDLTKDILRKTFLGPVKLNAINILDRENMLALRLYLEVELARACFAHMGHSLHQMDGEIPARLKHVTKLGDETIFLAEFWTVLETAEKLSTAKQAIDNMPFIRKETAELLSAINSTNLNQTNNQVGGPFYRSHGGSLKESKALILDLLSSLLREKSLDGLLDSSKLERLAAKTEAVRCTVVAAGSFSTGKSTFFNALMKEEILPTGNGPTTSSITRIAYGENKTATVHLPLQVVLPIDESDGEQSYLCVDRLDILEQYLDNNEPDELAYLEVNIEDGFQTVSRQEMSALLQRIRRHYAAGKFTGPAQDSTPSVYKPVPLKGLSRKKIPRTVRLTFHYAGRPNFDLTQAAQRDEFKKITGPDKAFRVAGIDIRHPSEYLKWADFVDTPGLDSIPKHDTIALTDQIRQCDAYLIFFNARHILSNLDQENLQNLFLPPIPADFKPESILEDRFEKVYFVINFADTLTPLQQETVTNFLRQRLCSFLSARQQAPAYPKIFLISALRALKGQDRGLELLLKDVEEGMIRSRGRYLYKNILSALYALLEETSQKLSARPVDFGPTKLSTGEKLQKRKQALAALRKFRREIKEIRNTIYHLGRM